MKFGSLKTYVQHPVKLLTRMGSQSFLKKMSDEKYLKMIFKDKTGYPLNLENPKTFNEKLQWLKIYNRNPIYTMMVDKYEAKKYVSNIIGEEYIIPTLGVWDSFDDIDFDVLPNRFVLKCTHDSGGLVICHNKNELNKEYAREKIEKCLQRNYYWSNREWPYKNVKPRIIAEEFLEDMDELVEYKMFCFNGEVKMILVCKGQAHGEGRTNDYCDMSLHRLPFTSLYPNSKGELSVPKELSELLDVAKKLSVGIPQIRVDTYLADGKIYFGELTFFHNSGMAKFDPPEWDEKLGEWIKLPSKKLEASDEI